MRGSAGIGRKVVTGLAIGAVAVACLVAGPAPLLVFVLALSIIAAGELFRLVRARGHRPMPFVGFAGIASLYAVAYWRGERAPALFPAVVGASVVLAFLVMLGRRKRGGATLGLSSTVLAILYPGLLGAYVIVLRRSPHGFRLAMVFGLMVVLHDTGSFFAGTTFGRRPLAPRVSPDKTWEGFLGGTIATFAVGAVAVLLFDPPFTWPTALVLAALVSAAAPLGDLSESLLKRDLGTKDSGKIFPGHGGALDRIDSAMFAAPIFFYAFRVLAR